MIYPSDLMASFRRILKLHESMLKEICSQYRLTLMEATIISFLKNNPSRDTAGDIVEYRMLSKGNVSQAVESLIQKSLLKRAPDLADRRKIHLALLPEAQPISEAIDRLQEGFLKELFWGFTEEELALYTNFNDRFVENTRRALERRKSDESR